ncbi:hypothetical protein F0726_00047 [Acidithiobacillus caldus]|nr:hypothetical protein F0726_00047 [Acidithiobacillus caldus]
MTELICRHISGYRPKLTIFCAKQQSWSAIKA